MVSNCKVTLFSCSKGVCSDISTDRIESAFPSRLIRAGSFPSRDHRSYDLGGAKRLLGAMAMRARAGGVVLCVRITLYPHTHTDDYNNLNHARRGDPPYSELAPFSSLTTLIFIGSYLR